MTHYDVCNGDADGLCALQQLRLADPQPARLITGPKRDIALLARVPAVAGDSVTVLDVSLAVNREALLALLERGVDVRYFDHHGSGAIPEHPRLHATIDTRPATCTSLIVDAWLAGAHRRWALVGAYGDGLVDVADGLAIASGIDEAARQALRELGIDLNYNAYGEQASDLIVPPAQLADRLRGHSDPLALRDDPLLARIRTMRIADLARGLAERPIPVGERAQLCILPDADWSRRVRGTLAQELVRRTPQRGVAVLSPDGCGRYVVSVRAPLATRTGADALCRQFASGEGRAAAAGINALPAERLDAFVAALRCAFG